MLKRKRSRSFGRDENRQRSHDDSNGDRERQRDNGSNERHHEEYRERRANHKEYEGTSNGHTAQEKKRRLQSPTNETQHPNHRHYNNNNNNNENSTVPSSTTTGTTTNTTFTGGQPYWENNRAHRNNYRWHHDTRLLPQRARHPAQQRQYHHHYGEQKSSNGSMDGYDHHNQQRRQYDRPYYRQHNSSPYERDRMHHDPNMDAPRDYQSLRRRRRSRSPFPSQVPSFKHSPTRSSPPSSQYHRQHLRASVSPSTRYTRRRQRSTSYEDSYHHHHRYHQRNQPHHHYQHHYYPRHHYEQKQQDQLQSHHHHHYRRYSPRRRRESDGYIDHKKRNSYYDNKEGHYNFVLGEYLSNRYEILKFMGEGTFARVIECSDREKNKNVAVKIVRSTQKYTEAAEIEIGILSDIKKKDQKDNSYCIKYIDSFMYRGHMCIVFPKLGLSLYDFLKKNNYVGFKIQHVQQLSYRLLKAVQFLHSIKLVHTDLKPENILLVDSKYSIQYTDEEPKKKFKVPDSTDIRVIDFGSATYEDQHHTSIISTRHYRAPEVILGLGWSYPADIWSVGCIIVELMTGDAMFQTRENREHLAMMEQILGSLPISMTKHRSKTANKYFRDDHILNWPEIASGKESVSFVSKLSKLDALCKKDSSDLHSRFYDLVSKLLDYEPSKRLTTSQALEHPFFKELKETNTAEQEAK